MPKSKSQNPWKKSLTTVTPLSKTIAFILFILMPFIGFYLGMNYQKTMDTINLYAAPVVQMSSK